MLLHQPDSVSTRGVCEHVAAETHWVLYPFPRCDSNAIICKCVKSQLGYIFFYFKNILSLGGCDHSVYFEWGFFFLGILKMYILFEDIFEFLSSPSPLLYSTCAHRDARAACSLHFFTLNPLPIALGLYLCPQGAWWASAPLPFGSLAWSMGSPCSKNSCQIPIS